jgi:NhaP-type Na+/H+ or K+/H+ antiporter
MGKRAIIVLAVIAIIVGVLQYTPLHFLSKDATDFVWGLVIGLAIGAIIAWVASRA